MNREAENGSRPWLDAAWSPARRLKLRREVPAGVAPPPGWQVAWQEPLRRVAVCYPTPLHWMARQWREFAWRIGRALRAPSRERHELFETQRVHRERQRLAEEYAAGYLTGWQECFDACREAVEEQLSAFDRAARACLPDDGLADPAADRPVQPHARRLAASAARAKPH